VTVTLLDVLSKVPSNVLYWFGTKVLQLKPELAMQTTEFLKSRTQLEPPPEQGLAAGEPGRLVSSDPQVTLSSDIERRLEKLEADYQMLQEEHMASLKLLTYTAEDTIANPRGLPFPTPPEPAGPPAIGVGELGELGQLGTPAELPWSSRSAASDIETQALVQEIGLRLGRVILEWAGDMMKQSLVPAASTNSPSDSRLVTAGVDIAGRLASSLTT
jgi:hypothetical protein